MNIALISESLKFNLDTLRAILREHDGELSDFHPRSAETPQVLIDLERYLRADPELSLFDGQLQSVGNGAIRWEIAYLARWLIRRAYRVGVEEAVSGLKRYVDSPKIFIKSILGLTGLNVKSKCEFENKITLVPWDSLQDSDSKKLISKKCFESVLPIFPSAAISQEIEIPKLHYQQDEQPKFAPVDQTDIDDAVLIISVVGPFAPRVFVSWWELPDWAPSLALGYSLPFPEGREVHDNWTDDHCLTATTLFKQFCCLDNGKKEEYRVPLRRLITGLRSLSLADRSIDLGIALESLFLGDEDMQGELNFRLRLRMSRYLETDIEKRKEVFNLAKDIYDLRSKAVHTGRLGNLHRSQQTTHLLLKGYELAALAIRRFILEGKPDWTAIQLK
jgi:hypothetical protein